MRRLLVLLLAAAVGVLVAGLVAGQPGYLLLAWADWRLEIRSLLLVLVVLVLVFGVLHWLLGAASRARQALLRRRLQRQLRRRERAEIDLAAGVMALVEGREGKARKLLTRGRRAAAAPELYALAFARLAQLRGDDVTREREFAAARAAAPNAAAAIARLQAQAQLAAGDLTGARATLSSVADDDSPQVLELRAQLARRSGDWLALIDVLPRLRKAGLIDAAHMAMQEAECACAQLAVDDVPDLLWPQLSRRLRRDSGVRLAYARALRRCGRHDAAQEQLAELLHDDWSAEAVAEFGRYAGSDPAREFARGEGWLKAHPENASLLLALARLGRKAGQMSRAQAYFEAALALEPSAEGHLELAELLQALGQAAPAAEQYRAGLRLALRTSPAVLTADPPAADDRGHLLPREA
ncbi:MAG TPA: hypothetical protein DCZ11_00060 [Gammaproteobacteria bacterium]|uniref:heme biosynthesis protein HemY n=1 Tax=Immundisolibacter sp. TaxID=1934948 RepID=UPI000E955267|nr:hypothetical protein [Gammaproteobacteria bacterium]MCH76819.1 hypothetical protein [Gammaproteobacteria bacterium]